MNRLFYVFLCVTFLSVKLLAQQPDQKEVSITGKVIDKETNQPLEYATIAFFSKRQNKIVTGGITNSEGHFNITVLTGIYDITVEYISFKTITIPNRKISAPENLGSFSLELDTEALGEVEIIAERTTVEVKLDKKIYNVGKDLTVRGGTVSDVLDNVPSVAVDAEGNVSLRGNDNVRILINGKPSGLVGLNSDALKQLPAEAIERVEVITSPSARYEAEGTAGILNIILRRSKLQGLNGAVSVNAGYPNAAGISGNVNFRTGNVNLFNTLAYRYNESIGNWYNYTRYKSTGNIFDEKRDWTNIRKGLTNNFGVEWYINDSASITTSFVYSNGDYEQNSINKLLQLDSSNTLTGQSLRLEPELNKNKTLQYSFNFTKDFDTSGHKLTFDFQFEDNTQNVFSIINTDGIDTDIVSSDEDETIILLRADYILPIGEKSQIEMGYRGDFSDKSTDYQLELFNITNNMFEIDNNLTNLFNFRNYINAAYIQYGNKINKFSYLLGIRMENTQITIDQPTSGDFSKRNYTGFFPTINLSYEFSESENMTLGYNRRLSRPWSFFLNPFPSRSSLTNIFQGNPGLDPEYSGKFDLGYLNRFGKFILSSSLYYQHSTNAFQFISKETGDVVNIDGRDVPVIQRGPANIATEERYGFDFNLNYSPSKKWRINTDFGLFSEIVDGDYEGKNFDSKNTRWNARLSNKYTLPASIDWQTNLDYRGPSRDAQNDTKGALSANLAFSKDLFKEKASIAFNINDVFNSRRRIGTVETESFITERNIQFRGGRTYTVSFTYRFNQKKKVDRGMRPQGGGEIDM